MWSCSKQSNAFERSVKNASRITPWLMGSLYFSIIGKKELDIKFFSKTTWKLRLNRVKIMISLVEQPSFIYFTHGSF